MPRLGSRVRVSFSALSDVLKMTYAQVAELVDAHVSGACVERHAGSSPVLGTLLLKKGESSHAEIAQLVEHNLAKVRVASSSLVFRSFQIKKSRKHCSVLAGFFCCMEVVVTVSGQRNNLRYFIFKHII